MLKGYKTYIVAVALILTAVASWTSGDLTLQAAITQVLTGLGIGALRNAIS